MHDLAFADATRPTPVAVLKLPMLPYSIGHEILLQSKRNPLVLQDSAVFAELSLEEQINSIIQAADVCSMTWKQNHWQPFTVWERLKFWNIWRKWRSVALNKANWPEEIEKWRQYRASGMLFPPTPDPDAAKIAYGDSSDRSGRTLGSPLLAQLIAYLAQLPKALICGDIMDTPLGYAAFLYFAHAETAGAFQVENAKEAQIKDELREAMEKIQKEQANA